MHAMYVVYTRLISPHHEHSIKKSQPCVAIVISEAVRRTSKIRFGAPKNASRDPDGTQLSETDALG